MSTPACFLRARWVLPVASPPIENGCVAISHGYITGVGQGRPAAAGQSIDLGDAVLLPGLVNAHTHLALTALKGQAPFDGDFAGWIRRLGTASEVLRDDAAFRNSLEFGLQASIRTGVVRVADIGYGQRSLDGWARAPIHVHGFLEVLGMGPKRWGRHDRSVDQALAMIRRANPPPARVLLGLSPHAPYSTDRIVYLDALRSGLRLCTHVAETRDEHQFLRDGTGPFRELLEQWDLWDGSFEPPGCSPVAYLRELQVLEEGMQPYLAPLLAHANYVSDEDLDLLACCNAHVVYCPRTHAFFGHSPHCYRDMLARGINVCLGTDSLASNSSLSVLDELRFLRSIDHEISDATLLQMATLNADRALGMGTTFGRVQPGYAADLIAVPLQHSAAADPLEDLLRGLQHPSHVFVGGEVVWPA